MDKGIYQAKYQSQNIGKKKLKVNKYRKIKQVTKGKRKMNKHNARNIVFFTALIYCVLIITIFVIILCKNETRIVAEVISAEACGEGELGMYFVANTIANRSRLYDISPYKVVTQEYQYAGLNNVNKDELYRQCYQYSNKLSKNIMDFPDLTNGALYFKRPEEERKSWHKKLTIIYKNHEFYK